MMLFYLLCLCVIAKIQPILSYEKTELDNIVANFGQQISEMRKESQLEMDMLRNEIDEMKIKHTELIEKHEIEIRTLRKEFAENYNSEISTLRREIGEIKSLQRALHKEVELLTAKLNARDRDVEPKNPDDDVSGSVIRHLAVDRQVDDTEDKLTGNKIQKRHYIQVQQIKRDVEKRVAFFAFLSTNAEHLGLNQVIVFDGVKTNIGHAYNERLGVFIAPVRGTYVFSCTLLVGGLKTWGQFVVNRQVVAKLLVDLYNAASQTIVVNLNAGDDVSVQNANTDRAYYGYLYSTFSGFLLFEDAISGVAVGCKQSAILHDNTGARNVLAGARSPQ